MIRFMNGERMENLIKGHFNINTSISGCPKRKFYNQEIQNIVINIFGETIYGISYS